MTEKGEKMEPLKMNEHSLLKQKFNGDSLCKHAMKISAVEMPEGAECVELHNLFIVAAARTVCYLYKRFSKLLVCLKFEKRVSSNLKLCYFQLR